MVFEKCKRLNISTTKKKTSRIDALNEVPKCLDSKKKKGKHLCSLIIKKNNNNQKDSPPHSTDNLQEILKSQYYNLKKEVTQSWFEDFLVFLLLLNVLDYKQSSVRDTNHYFSHFGWTWENYNNCCTRGRVCSRERSGWSSSFGWCRAGVCNLYNQKSSFCSQVK